MSEVYTITDRTINIPSNTIIGVESDEKSKRLYFECNKIVGDNIDLSQMNLYINYRNANGEKNMYVVADASVTNDKITFSWLLYRQVTEYKGKINFIVCARKTDEQGAIDVEWNTTLASATVIEGLEVDTTPIEQETNDLVEQLKSILTQKGNEVKASITSLGNEVKASIPSDYSALSETVENINTFKLEVETGTGDTIITISKVGDSNGS